MLGIVIPAHNEERLLPACLRAINRIIRKRKVRESTRVLVVADACHDRTAELAKQAGAAVLQVGFRCVGAARDAGARALIAEGASWIACTDADSEVPEGWLEAHRAAGADAFCGLVRVANWNGLPARVIHRFLEGYQRSAGHRHVHGANLGFTPDAYQQAGGFPALHAHEDVAIVSRFEKLGLHIDWSAAGAVTTSARLDHRAPEGFGAKLAACLEHFPHEPHVLSNPATL